MEPGNGGYEDGQFVKGLQIIEQEKGELGFEELMIKLRKKNDGLCVITYDQLRTGSHCLLWKIHESIKEVAPAYKNFAGWIRKKQQCGIISFNWDLQVELLLDQAKLSWGYSPESDVPIIKPHGSINWSQHPIQGVTAYSSLWKPIRPGCNFMCILNDPFMNPKLSEVVPQLNFLLFPGDPEDNKDLDMLWKDALEIMNTAEEIVFIGYSFPDYDSYTQDIFKDNIQNKKIIVINPSIAHLQKSKSVLGMDVEVHQKKFSDCLYGVTPPELGPGLNEKLS